MNEPVGRRTLLGWMCIGASFVLVVVAVALMSLGLGDSSDARTAGDESDLLAAQATIERASTEVVALRLFDAAGLDGDRTDRLATAADELVRASDDLAAFAATDDVANAAWTLIGYDALSDPVEGDIAELMWAAESIRWELPSDRLTDGHTAVHELAFLAALPWHVAIETMVIAGGRQAVPRS